MPCWFDVHLVVGKSKEHRVLRYFARNCIKCAWTSTYLNIKQTHTLENKSKAQAKFASPLKTKKSSTHVWIALSSSFGNLFTMFRSFNAAAMRAIAMQSQYEWCTNMQPCLFFRTNDLVQFSQVSFDEYVRIVGVFECGSSESPAVLSHSQCLTIKHDYYTNLWCNSVVNVRVMKTISATRPQSMTNFLWIKYKRKPNTFIKYLLSTLEAENIFRSRLPYKLSDFFHIELCNQLLMK